MVLMNEILDGLDPFLGLLDAQSARGPDVHLECAGIDLREEIAAHDRPDQRRASRPASRNRPPMVRTGWRKHEVEPLDVILDRRRRSSAASERTPC